MAEIDEIVGEFLIESYENLDRYDEDLLALERDPSDVEILSSIFRTVHTIKGTCGFFGFDRLQAVAHVAENLLGRLRDRDLVVTAEIATALLATGDAVRAMLADIEATGEEGPSEHGELVATLERLHAGEVAAAPAVADAPAPEAAVAEAAVADAGGADAAGAAARSPAEVPAPEVPAAEVPANGHPTGDDTRLGALLVDAGSVDGREVHLALHQQELGDARPIGEILVGHGEVPPAEVDQALATQAAVRSVSDSSIRVDVGLLDELMNLVGELVLARNQIVQLVTQDQDSVFANASQRLNLITTELQEGVMKTRMQPIGNVWNKLPRVVRDLSASIGKRVELVMEGQDTELDKTIIEAIKDPLTHLVRNAVDHGIEVADARLAAGKPEVGTLTLRAYHEGGQVNIEIADDGGGIDPERLKAKALEKGVINAGQAASMSDHEALQLIFEAGLSTASAVTNVSGRGVGMDVVRTNIERIGGTVDVHTEAGVGTSFKVKIPLTLAIIPALVVTSCGERYAIPQLSLLELVRLEGEQTRTGIEMISGTPVHRLRGRLLPIVGLRDELGQDEVARQDGAGRDVINIVVLQADGHQFGLVVDEINDTQEIVVKPLGTHLKDTTIFAGATIMGDGRVALILDVLGIAQHARVVTGARDRAILADEVEEAGAGTARRTLLLVGLGRGASGEERRAAIALSDVARLEEFSPDAVEFAGSGEVVQYRGEILPLVRLGQALGVTGGWAAAEEVRPLNVVVHHLGGRDVGLVVDAILDIVDERIELSEGASSHGVLGSAVIQGRVTDVVDVHQVLRMTAPAYVGA